MLSRIGSALVFSKFDMKIGFWQLSTKEEDGLKTAFSVPIRHYEWNVMPFCIENSPYKLQIFMDNAFKPYFELLLVYIDDLLVF